MTDIEISQGNANSDLHIRPTALAVLVSEVSATAEKSREQVERIMLPATAALLPLLQSFVAIAVIDLPSLGVREGLVSFGYFNKFLFG